MRLRLRENLRQRYGRNGTRLLWQMRLQRPFGNLQRQHGRVFLPAQHHRREMRTLLPWLLWESPARHQGRLQKVRLSSRERGEQLFAQLPAGLFRRGREGDEQLRLHPVPQGIHGGSLRDVSCRDESNKIGAMIVRVTFQMRRRLLWKSDGDRQQLSGLRLQRGTVRSTHGPMLELQREHRRWVKYPLRVPSQYRFYCFCRLCERN